MSPLEVLIALHYATHADDFRDGDFSAPVVRETIDDFKARGLLVDDPTHERCYNPSEGLRVYTDAVCSVPLPELKQVWVMPEVKP